jgi:Bacterial extracellular solute-binding protein
MLLHDPPEAAISRRAAPRPASARGRRGVSALALAAAALLLAGCVMAALTAQAVLDRRSCARHPAVLDVAASGDIAPVIDNVARRFNRRRTRAGCVQVRVTAVPPAVAAARIDGQHPAAKLPAIDAWIPDSSLWVDIARRFPVGARAIRLTGLSLARSPLLIVMPGPVAARTPQFDASVGWSFLLPASAGGPPSDLRLRADLPDPARSSAGLATLIEIGRLVGLHSPAASRARAKFIRFAQHAHVTARLDNPASLASFVALAGARPPGRPVTVASEQAVIAYDRSHPRAPLAARYPVSARRWLGTPELDYPYVLTTANPLLRQVSAEFERALRQGYVASLVRYLGFRTADGIGDAIPASDGLSSQPLTVADPPGAGQAQAILQTWDMLTAHPKR